MNDKRIAYLDCLRIVSILAVIVLHVSAAWWRGCAPGSGAWQIANVINGATRWAVPVFVMISGALFLSRDIPVKTLYSKYALRLAIAYVVWAVIYTLPRVALGKTEGMQILLDLLRGSGHLWFLPMLIGLYLCQPILRQITRSKAVTRYFLVLSFVVSFAIPFLLRLVTDFFGVIPGRFAEEMRSVLSYAALQTVSGFSFYYVLGYYLHKCELTAQRRRAVYALGIVGFALTIGLTVLFQRKTGEAVERYFDPLSMNAALMAAAVFTWARTHVQQSGKVMQGLAKYAFGAYLCHMLFLAAPPYLGIDLAALSPLVWIPLVSLGVAAVSFAVSFVLNRIPVLNRWIV